MAANRLENKNNFDLIQKQMQQMNQFQNLLAGLIPQLENKNIKIPITNNDTPPTDNEQQTDIDQKQEAYQNSDNATEDNYDETPIKNNYSQYDSSSSEAEESEDEETPEPTNTTKKKVHMADESMHEKVPHDAPDTSESTPSPKRPKDAATVRKSMSQLIPLTPKQRASPRNANKIPIPTNQAFTTADKKVSGGKS
jgi:hypothetical protein